HTLCGAKPHVAGGEHAGLACLQQEWLALARPARRVRKLAASADESLGIGVDLRRKPVRVRDGADERAQRGRVDGSALAGCRVFNEDALEAGVAMQLPNLR